MSTRTSRQGAVPLSRRLRDPRTIISIVLPIVVLLLLARGPARASSWTSCRRSSSQANPWWLLAAVGIYYLGFPLRGYRWALLIRGTGYPLKVKDSTEIILISWLVNCVVPAKLGDVYRAYLLRINTGVSLSKTFGTVFIERVFDLSRSWSWASLAGFWSFRDGHGRRRSSSSSRSASWSSRCSSSACSWSATSAAGSWSGCRCPIASSSCTTCSRRACSRSTGGACPLIAVVTVLIWTTEALRLLLRHPGAAASDINVGISGAFFVALIASLLTAVPFTPAGLGLVELRHGGRAPLGLRRAPRPRRSPSSLVDRAISVLSVIVVGSIAYVFSSKTRGDPAFTPGGDGDPGTRRRTDRPCRLPQRPRTAR